LGPLRGRDAQLHVLAEIAQGLQQAVGGELGDPAVHQRRHAGPVHAHQAAGLGLGETPILDDRGQPTHELGAQDEVVGIIETERVKGAPLGDRDDLQLCHIDFSPRGAAVPPPLVA